MASNYQVLTSISSRGTDAPIGPYLIPPSLPQGPSASALVVSVAHVQGSAPRAGPCTITRSGANTDFSLAWAAPDQQPVAQVTVQPTHVYSDQQEDRAALLASFTAFRLALDEMEQTASPQCLAPGGADVIARAVSGSIPLRLDEVMTYHHGLVPGGNCLDLAPGMRLRINTGGYDFVAPSSPWNGFGAAGSATCAVARSSAQDVCFDTFLGTMATSVELGSPAWIGGIGDLAALGPRRYFRLVYPRTMVGPTQTSAARELGRTPALLGADTLTDLAAATTAYFKDGACATATSGRPVLCAAFVSRTSVVPEILVRFLGQWRFLPVGSTVQHLLDLYSPLCRSQFPGKGSATRLTFNRMSIAGLSSPPAFGRTLVSFEDPTQYVARPEGGQLSQWDLPLLQGDSFWIASEAAA